MDHAIAGQLHSAMLTRTMNVVCVLVLTMVIYGYLIYEFYEFGGNQMFEMASLALKPTTNMSHYIN